MNKDIQKYLQDFIYKMQAQGKTPSIEDLNTHLASYMQKQNNSSKPDFEGYSSAEMHQILNFTFGKDSPIQIRELNSEEYMQMPLFRQVKCLVNTLVKEDGIKLTAAGNLPIRIVKEMHPLGIEEWYIDERKTKLIKESDSSSVHLARILIEISGITKKRIGVLSLTASGKKLADHDAKLFNAVFEAFCLKFNWGYLDLYESKKIGKLGFGFSLILLSKYGDKEHPNKFYAEKYFRAFPNLYEGVQPDYGSVEEYCSDCYSLRTFDRILLYFGLISIRREKKFDTVRFIRKTELYDKLISVLPHKEFNK